MNPTRAVKTCAEIQCAYQALPDVLDNTQFKLMRNIVKDINRSYLTETASKEERCFYYEVLKKFWAADLCSDQISKLLHKLKQDSLQLDFPVKTFSEIQQIWDTFQNLDIKKKLKTIKSLVHDISMTYQRNSGTPKQRDFYLEVLTEAAKYSVANSNLIKKKILLDKQTDRPNVPIKIVEKINGEIQGGLGGLDIGDPELYAGQTLIQDMNEGKIFRVETSGDGLRNVQLRIVEATEPLLSRSEMRHVKTASETAIINLKSGNIAIASQDQLADMDWKYRISHQVSPGHYKVCVYHKGDVLYVVLCKTSLEAKNNFYRFFIFEEY